MTSTPKPIPPLTPKPLPPTLQNAKMTRPFSKRTPKPIPPVAVAYLVRHLVTEKHLLMYTKQFAQVVASLAPYMDGIEQEWAATQPTPELADAYISAQLERLTKAQDAFLAEKAAHEKQRKAVAKEIVRLTASL